MGLGVDNTGSDNGANEMGSSGNTSEAGGSNKTDSAKDDNKNQNRTDADKFQKELTKTPNDRVNNSCTGLNTNHVTCTISDVYGGTPPQEKAEEEESSASVNVEGEASTGGPKIEKNKNGGYNLSASTPYAEGKATAEAKIHEEFGSVKIDANAKVDVEGNTGKVKMEVTDKGFEVDIKKPGASGKIDAGGGITCFIETASY